MFNGLKVNEKGNFKMLLVSVKEKMGRNGPFCIMTLKPSKKDPAIDARMWNCERGTVTQYTPEMSVVNVLLDCSEYNGEKSYVVASIAAASDVPVTAFVDSSDIDGAKMYGHVCNTANSKCFAGTPENAIFNNIYAKYKGQLMYWPAAISIHHNYIGGLICHMGTVASDCLKFYSAASPAETAKIRDKDAGTVVSDIVTVMSGYAESSAFVSSAFEPFRAFSFVDAPAAAKRRYMALQVADRIVRNYPFVNRDVLFTALMYRDIHSLTGDPMASVIGGAPADVLCFRNSVKPDAGNEEKRKMVEHAILVDAGNDIRPVTAEAFLALYSEKLADAALKHMDDDFNLCALYTAAALHDIGKLEEYASDPYAKAEFTTDGYLYGHAMIGVEMVLQSARELSIDPSAIAKLLNCIAAHHDKKEWGALVAPMSEEAEVLAMLDYIDSRMDIYHKRAEGIEPGTFDDSSVRGAGVRVYKPAF